MQLRFEKYQGTGNDFVMIDQRLETFIAHDNQKLIAHLCDRRFGIGADGLILLENSEAYDFKMVYFNADGRQSSMCGNGGRCIVHFAWKLGAFIDKTIFEAIDGLHAAHMVDEQTVSLQMSDVQSVKSVEEGVFVMNTGSPHYVSFMDKLPEDVKTAGASIRYSDTYAAEGINVNFVVKTAEGLEVATYERGVEDETYSCGTGVTACALANQLLTKNDENHINILTKGGHLSVSFKNENGSFKDVWLTGPASFVFAGNIEI